MTEAERKEARRLMKLQESLKDDPAMRCAYEYSQRKIQEDKKREEILKNWGSNGYVSPEIRNLQPRPKTEEEKRIEELVKNFS